jgi:hypothetical protein
MAANAAQDRVRALSVPVAISAAPRQAAIIPFRRIRNHQPVQAATPVVAARAWNTTKIEGE